jgi:hypothetical protein
MRISHSALSAPHPPRGGQPSLARTLPKAMPGVCQPQAWQQSLRCPTPKTRTQDATLLDRFSHPCQPPLGARASIPGKKTSPWLLSTWKGLKPAMRSAASLPGCTLAPHTCTRTARTACPAASQHTTAPFGLRTPANTAAGAGGGRRRRRRPGWACSLRRRSLRRRRQSPAPTALGPCSKGRRTGARLRPFDKHRCAVLKWRPAVTACEPEVVIFQPTQRKAATRAQHALVAPPFIVTSPRVAPAPLRGRFLQRAAAQHQRHSTARRGAGRGASQ